MTPQTITTGDFIAALGTSWRNWYRHNLKRALASAGIYPVMLGRRDRWRVSDIEQALAAQERRTA